MRVLGLDVGRRRIGLAVGDTATILATPVGALQRQGKASDVQSVLETARRQQAECIVVGIPYSLDGSLGPQGREVMAFYKVLKDKSPVPVEPWDERFSTVDAERLLREGGVKPSREKGRLDAASAAIILQAYLDGRQGTRP